MLGVVGGSSLLKSDVFKSMKLEPRSVTTEYGVAHVLVGKSIVFCQRHHASEDKQYKPPNLINYKSIACALNVRVVTDYCVLFLF